MKLRYGWNKHPGGEHQTCNVCGRSLPLSCFCPDKSLPGGYKKRCRQCIKAAESSKAKRNRLRHMERSISRIQ